MSDTPKYEIHGDCLYFRPVAEGPLADAVRLVADAIAYARERGLPKAMINTSQLTGFAPPNPAERYFFFRDWAAASQGRVQVAFVARPEMIDPEKFGITVAVNAGFSANAFVAEPAAIAWLAQPKRS